MPRATQASALTREYLDGARDMPRALVGMLKLSVRGGGSKWVYDHIAILLDCDNDRRTVIALFDREIVQFDNFRPPEGGRDAAKWYADYHISRDTR
jgi:hypothetical protein